MPAAGDDDAPLDPAAEKVRRRLVRLLIVSFGTMILGFVAVFGAIVYKLGLFGSPAAPAPTSAVAPPIAGNARTTSAGLALPEGTQILSSALDGGRILLQLKGPQGQEELVVVEAASGKVVHRLSLVRVP
ncbi:hypothetical protein CLD20_19615 [Afifella sp. IM 167]|nr:hypothetical protein [Afifella sp. IM 167]